MRAFYTFIAAVWNNDSLFCVLRKKRQTRDSELAEAFKFIFVDEMCLQIEYKCIPKVFRMIVPFSQEPHAHDEPCTKVRHLKELALPIITNPLLQPGVPGCTGLPESLGVRSIGSSTGLCVVERCTACWIEWIAACSAACCNACPWRHFIVFAW